MLCTYRWHAMSRGDYAAIQLSHGASLLKPKRKDQSSFSRCLQSGSEPEAPTTEEGFMRNQFMMCCALLTGVVSLSGCRTAATQDFTGTFVERFDQGTVAWDIRADGTVKALLKSKDDKPIVANVTGRVATDDGSV